MAGLFGYHLFVPCKINAKCRLDEITQSLEGLNVIKRVSIGIVLHLVLNMKNTAPTDFELFQRKLETKEIFRKV